MKQQPANRNFLLLIGFLIAFLHSTKAQDVVQYEVQRISAEINIDGKLDEQVWTDAKATDNFVILGDNQTVPKTNTWAKLLWDDTYLYVAFYCVDVNLVATYTDRDDPLYKEDVVEVYIDPDGDGENYLEVEVSPTNIVFDLWLTKPRKEGGQGNTDWTMDGLKTQSTYKGSLNSNSDEDESWICEMALPFVAMKFSASSVNFPPQENDVWRFNLYRFDRAYNNDKNGEATGWSQTEGGQHEPTKFGKIIFDGWATGSNQLANSVQLFELQQNYPNPCKRATTINFYIPCSNHVDIAIFNSRGIKIEQLVDEVLVAGHHKICWNAGNNAEGIYYYRMLTNDFSATRKMIVIK